MEIWTDSSFLEKEKIAGIGLVVKRKGKIYNVPSWSPAFSNNFGEMWAIHLAGVLAGGEKCIIYTDSQTALDYINGLRGREYEQKHKHKWTKQQYINHKRLQLLGYRIRKISPNLRFEKVKAHQRNYKRANLSNNIADLTAKMGVSLYLSR